MNSGLVMITMPQKEYETRGDKLLEMLGQKLKKGQIDSIAKSGENSIISYRFFRLSRKKCMELQKSVQAFAEGCNMSVFFNRQPTV